MMKNILLEKVDNVEMYDPWIDSGDPPLKNASVFFIGTNHDKFLDYEFPEGSVVIDPWGMLDKDSVESRGVEVVLVGRG